MKKLVECQHSWDGIAFPVLRYKSTSQVLVCFLLYKYKGKRITIYFNINNVYIYYIIYIYQPQAALRFKEVVDKLPGSKAEAPHLRLVGHW